jgi:hypothetical protein
MSDSHPVRVVDDPHLEQARRVIQSTYGDVVSVTKKAKNLLKFGRNPNVPTTGATLWATGQDDAHETYVADGVNSIDTISSATTDTQVIKVEGHTSTTDNHGVTRKTFVVQSVTLTGTTKALLPTPLNRVTRAYNTGSTDLADEVYIYEDTAIVAGKPTDTSKIHLTIAHHNQSEKASTSLSSQDYWLITEMHAYVLEKTSAWADIGLEVREQGGVFRHHAVVAATSGGVDYHIVPYIIIPPNADIRLVATASGASIDVAGLINGYLAIVV